MLLGMGTRAIWNSAAHSKCSHSPHPAPSQTNLTAVVKEHGIFSARQFSMCFRDVASSSLYLSSPIPLITSSHKGE